MNLAPIVLFAYNRPEHVGMTLESLRDNFYASASDLFVYCDGPKANSSENQINNVKRVREVVRKEKWCRTVTIIESDSNKGLAQSIITGVTDIVKRYGKIIVVEDDVLLSRYFLQFMNDALEAFKEDSKVCAIGSWNYFCEPEKLKNNFFLRYPDSIGWATFDRAWSLFEKDATNAFQKLESKGLLKRLNGGGSVTYFGNMLRDQMNNKIDSWAIRWTATAIIHNMMCFYPRNTLSKHIGFGDGATNETSNYDYNKHLRLSDHSIKVNKISVIENAVAFQRWKAFVTVNFIKRVGIRKRLIERLQRLKDKVAKQYRNKKRTVKIRSGLFTIYSFLRLEPVSRCFGMDRGTPIDRFYIEQFLKKSASYIEGNILEVGDSVYAETFGKKINRIDILDVALENPKATIICDLTKHELLPQNMFDCFICTQTLNFVYDFRSAIQGSYYLLKKGGVTLTTVAAITQISNYDAQRWGDYWRFTPQGIKLAFEEVFGRDNVEIESYGNSYAATAFLKGISKEEISERKLNYKDADYPIVITLVAKKNV